MTTPPTVAFSCASPGAACGACAQAPSARALAEACNQGCFCNRLDRAELAAAFARLTGDDDAVPGLLAERPHLFADYPVFLPESDRSAMLGVVSAVTSAVSATDDDGRSGPEAGATGVFMGYDFHVGDGPPRLIEINTNAGGAFLNALASGAYGRCSALAGRMIEPEPWGRFAARTAAMFETEWTAQRGQGRAGSIAVADDDPERQYLYPEFLVARRLFSDLGYRSLIVDARDLSFADGRLRAGEEEIDLVYNRLVDFSLSDMEHAGLSEAWRAGAAVVTPNPLHHARLADKRILTLLTDPAYVAHLRISEKDRDALATIPRAYLLTEPAAEALWAQRKSLFFKPASGYGARAVYRGASVSRTVFERMVSQNYIAQAYAEPSDRVMRVGGEERRLKLDVRVYVYRDEPLLFAARLYRGQATNFRTEGGGFAPVIFLKEAASRADVIPVT